ncbi:XK-related protein 8-like [Oreochromis aureus]|uniref:XK-related protein n=1 Tax=Oreochromis aureus TaxID=47969 RepID=A0AAZ1Y4N5_OREAU|nr:XK-related protein 8-like [Oreochromis aureus]
MSGTQANFKYSGWDFLFTCVGLPLYLVDIGLDIWTAVSFYKEKAYVCLAVLLVLLLGSSLLTQAYSWLWYSYEKFRMKTKVEGWPTKRLLKLLHVFQLGIYFRHAGVLEKAVESFHTKLRDPEGVAVFLSHDLSMLRIVETFSESAPQLTLMLTIILQQGHLDPVTVLKAVGSASAIAFTVTTYHRSLRSFLPAKENQKISSSVIYLIWNLVLISSRLTALALFASVLPCFIFTHFICSWLVLFFFAWRSKTDFMDSSCGEWLYRATVGLIWYFNWFSVAKGTTRYRTALYHGYILTDICILCAVWCWKMSTDPPDFVIEPMHALITAACVIAVYVLGLILKVIYYKVFHPNPDKDELKGASTEQQPEGEVGLYMFAAAANMAAHHPPAPSAHCNKRMRKLAENFYS